MTTEPVPATAGGMPELSRRRFLSYGAAAAAAGVAIPVAAPASTIAVPAADAASALVSAVAAAREAECPELLKLGADLALARKRYADAEAAIDGARAQALKMAPAIPEGLAVPFGASVFGQVGWYSLPEPTDILGDAIDLPRHVSPRTGRSLPVRIPTTGNIIEDRRSARRIGSRLPSWLKGEHRRLYDLAVQFERETDEAREASGLNAAEEELWVAARDLRVLADQIGSAEPRTIAGILIKAQAANTAGLKYAWISASLAGDCERVIDSGSSVEAA